MGSPGTHGGWHRHGLAEIGQTGATIGPGIEPRIRRQSTGAKPVEGGKTGPAKHRPEIGIGGEEVGFDGGKTAANSGETALTPSSSDRPRFILYHLDTC